MNKIIKLIIILIIIVILISTTIFLIKKDRNKLPEEVDVTEPEDIITIEANEYNSFNSNSIAENKKVIYIFNDFKQRELYNLEQAYEALNEEYKKARFNGIKDFEKFINENRKQIKEADVYSYKINNYDEYTEYIILDQFDNYYAFKETSVLNYSVKLDDFITFTDEQLFKYKSLSDQEKVVINIQKFVKAINKKSYYYAYNCLAKGFKDNYFQTQEAFENYINETWYNGNFEVEFGDFEEEGGLYKYKFKIINNENPEENIETTFIMKLNEETNFETSFNK